MMRMETGSGATLQNVFILWQRQSAIGMTIRATQPYVGFFPSHVLPHFYYLPLLYNGQLPVGMFGSTLENQLAWLDLGQMWAMKPAVLLPVYR